MRTRVVYNIEYCKYAGRSLITGPALRVSIERGDDRNSSLLAGILVQLFQRPPEA